MKLGQTKTICGVPHVVVRCQMCLELMWVNCKAARFYAPENPIRLCQACQDTREAFIERQQRSFECRAGHSVFCGDDEMSPGGETACRAYEDRNE